MTTARSGALDVFGDLEAEIDHLHGILATLAGWQWALESGAAKWSVSDVVLHLALSEEGVAAAVRGERPDLGPNPTTIEDFVARLVDESRGAPPAEVLTRWRDATRAAVAGLRAADPAARVPWLVGPMSPRALATTRLAEHWAHTLDIAAPLGIPYPDTDRLRHVAWLAHRQLPYSFDVAGRAGGPVRCELYAPDGGVWRFGDDDVASVITGPAGEFCRVAAQRLRPEETSLTTAGPYAAAALHVARTYAV